VMWGANGSGYGQPSSAENKEVMELPSL
jgi:hypothetical protein